MHLGSPGWQRTGELQGQFPQGWYANVESVTANRRSRGGVQPEDAATGAPGAARLRLHAGLSVPRPAARHAPEADRNRAFKFVEYKNKPGHQGDPQPELLETGPAYLDGIEYTIITNARRRSWPSRPAIRRDLSYEITSAGGDIKSQMPTAICDISPMNVAANLLMIRCRRSTIWRSGARRHGIDRKASSTS